MSERDFSREFWAIVESDEEREERMMAAYYDEGLITVIRTIIIGDGKIANEDYLQILNLLTKEYSIDPLAAEEVFDRCEELVIKGLEHDQA